MKTNGARKTGKAFFTIFAMTAAAAALAAGTAAAQGAQAPAVGDAAYCRCDARTGQEMLDDLVKDVRQRGMTAEAAKSYAEACIASWCSCSGDAGTVRSCVSEVVSHFDSAMSTPAQPAAAK